MARVVPGSVWLLVVNAGAPSEVDPRRAYIAGGFVLKAIAPAPFTVVAEG